MRVNCKDIWSEISNYIDDGIEPALRRALEDHIRGCKHCAAVLQGTRNIVRLYGDQRMCEVPQEFSQRLRRKIAEKTTRDGLAFFG